MDHGNVFIPGRGSCEMAAVARVFLDDWGLSPVAYAILIRTASARSPEALIEFDILPNDTPQSVIDAAMVELSESGHVKQTSGGGYMLTPAPDKPQRAIQSGLIPVPERQNALNTCALYRWFDTDGVLLYVGITKNPKSRFGSHASMSRWYTLSCGDPSVEWFPSRTEAAVAESAAIATESPLFNYNADDGGVAKRRLMAYLDSIGRPDLLPTRYINESVRTNNRRPRRPESEPPPDRSPRCQRHGAHPARHCPLCTEERQAKVDTDQGPVLTLAEARAQIRATLAKPPAHLVRSNAR